MRRSSNRRSKILFLLATGLVGAAYSAARPLLARNATSALGDCSPIRTAQAFLQDFYPELRNMNLEMYLDARGSFEQPWSYLPRLDVVLGDGPPCGGRPQGASGCEQGGFVPEVNQRLGAHFDFFLDGRIQNVSIVSEDLANQRKNDRLRNLVDHHQDWSDAEVVTALGNAGARFGPNQKDAFLKQLPIDLLGKYVGELRMESAEFELRHDQPGGPIAELYWSVRIKAQASGTSNRACGLEFEPFGGKLIALVCADASR